MTKEDQPVRSKNAMHTYLRTTALAVGLFVSTHDPGFAQDKVWHQGGQWSVQLEDSWTFVVCDIPGQIRLPGSNGGTKIVPYAIYVNRYQSQPDVDIDPRLRPPSQGKAVWGWCHTLQDVVKTTMLQDGRRLLEPATIPIKQGWPINLGMYGQFAGLQCHVEANRRYFDCTTENDE